MLAPLLCSLLVAAPADPPAELKPGDRVVLPSRGVFFFSRSGRAREFTEGGPGKLEGLESLKDLDVEVYELKRRDGLRTFVKKADKKACRPISTAAVADDALRIIASATAPKGAWPDRHKRYTEKVKSGGLVELATVYGELRASQATRPLVIGEKRMLDQTHDLVVEEVSAAKDVSFGEAARLVEGR